MTQLESVNLTASFVSEESWAKILHNSLPYCVSLYLIIFITQAPHPAKVTLPLPPSSSQNYDPTALHSTEWLTVQFQDCDWYCWMYYC